MPVDRAKQFMPFSALQGYYDLIAAKECTFETKKELSDEQTALINNTLKHLRKGKIVELTYYNHHGYEKISGCITGIDLELKTLNVIKTKIPFADILDIRETDEQKTKKKML